MACVKDGTDGAARVVVAKHAGACYGVQRALRIAHEAAQSGAGTYTLGPLIHNPQVVAELDCTGVHPVGSLGEVPDGATVIIRSHGVTASTVEQAHARGLQVLDATCPHVAKAQQAARGFYEDGRFVVVVGEAGHPEVEGICSYASGRVAVAASPDELPACLPERVGVVVQTTQSREMFDTVVGTLRQRVANLEVADTVCLATRERQQAAAELACEVDCMIVVGGKNSGNTKRLTQICERVCPDTHHIETTDEISAGWFDGCRVVGITAGASTPQDYIEDTCDAVRDMLARLSTRTSH